MLLLELHLVEGVHTPAQHAELLARASARGAEVLGAPLDRVRACLALHRPEHWATGGVVGVEAPCFTALVLDGVAPGRRRRLLEAVTDLLVDVVGADRRLVRGRIVRVHPDDWADGGVPVGAARTPPA
jgi:phenylpyruvate tautomerase PptA (4-oxalocrotonate tautomerase family)